MNQSIRISNRTLTALLIAIMGIDVGGRALTPELNSTDWASSSTGKQACLDAITHAYNDKSSVRCTFTVKTGKDEAHEFATLEWTQVSRLTKPTQLGQPVESTKEDGFKIILANEEGEQTEKLYSFSDVAKTNDAIYGKMHDFVLSENKRRKDEEKKKKEEEKLAKKRADDFKNCIRDEDGQPFESKADKIKCKINRIDDEDNRSKQERLTRETLSDLRKMARNEDTREEAMALIEDMQVSLSPSARRSASLLKITTHYQTRLEDAHKEFLANAHNPWGQQMALQKVNALEQEMRMALNPFRMEAQMGSRFGSGTLLAQELYEWDMTFLNSTNATIQAYLAGSQQQQAGGLAQGLNQQNPNLDLRSRTARSLPGTQILRSQSEFSQLMNSNYYNSLIDQDIQRARAPMGSNRQDTLTVGRNGRIPAPGTLANPNPAPPLQRFQPSSYVGGVQ